MPKTVAVVDYLGLRERTNWTTTVRVSLFFCWKQGDFHEKREAIEHERAITVRD
jgi:hypothetical protein